MSAIRKISKFDRRCARNRFHLKQNLSGRKRLSIFKSNKNIYAQLIDDAAGHTVASASTSSPAFIKLWDGKADNRCSKVAADMLADIFVGNAKSVGISSERVVFDRGGYKYCGVVKAFADKVRSLGFVF